MTAAILNNNNKEHDEDGGMVESNDNECTNEDDDGSEDDDYCDNLEMVDDRRDLDYLDESDGWSEMADERPAKRRRSERKF